MNHLKTYVSLLLLSFWFSPCAGQSIEQFDSINNTWKKFYAAFDNLDYKLMKSIHSKDLVRVAGGERILNYNEYINSYKNRFAAIKESSGKRSIALRFFERTHTDSIASERGIYRLVAQSGDGTEGTYYGQFHVILKKSGDRWLIWMDYDSTENDTIGETRFYQAYDINNFTPFSN